MKRKQQRCYLILHLRALDVDCPLCPTGFDCPIRRAPWLNVKSTSNLQREPSLEQICWNIGVQCSDLFSLKLDQRLEWLCFATENEPEALKLQWRAVEASNNDHAFQRQIRFSIIFYDHRTFREGMLTKAQTSQEAHGPQNVRQDWGTLLKYNDRAKVRRE